MEPWQEQVIEEEAELAVKLEEFEAFLETDEFKARPKDPIRLLPNQQRHMKFYLAILRQRIAKFE